MQQANNNGMIKPSVILGVTESDAHVVANHLIAFLLKEKGFDVINLGACTSVAEFTQAYQDYPESIAMIIGSMNGHAYEDLDGLADKKQMGQIKCPVILGGNLSVGSQKSPQQRQRFYSRGVDYLLENAMELPPLLSELASGKMAATA